jgi:predicted AAA+ superfamily ATPase
MKDSCKHSIIQSALHRKFRFYKEPTQLIEKLLQSLKEGGETTIIVHGKFGVGKTALVEYVRQKHAMVLCDMFPGGVFQMKYGHDCDIIASQGELLRQLMELGKVGPFFKTIP